MTFVCFLIGNQGHHNTIIQMNILLKHKNTINLIFFYFDHVDVGSFFFIFRHLTFLKAEVYIKSISEAVVMLGETQKKVI